MCPIPSDCCSSGGMCIPDVSTRRPQLRDLKAGEPVQEVAIRNSLSLDKPTPILVEAVGWMARDKRIGGRARWQLDRWPTDTNHFQFLVCKKGPIKGQTPTQQRHSCRLRVLFHRFLCRSALVPSEAQPTPIQHGSQSEDSSSRDFVAKTHPLEISWNVSYAMYTSQMSRQKSTP